MFLLLKIVKKVKIRIKRKSNFIYQELLGSRILGFPSLLSGHGEFVIAMSVATPVTVLLN